MFRDKTKPATISLGYSALEIRRGVDCAEKPQFHYLEALKKSGLEKGIETASQCADAKEMLAGYKQLKTEAVKTYDEMIRPLNKRRAVVLEWKRDDVEAIEKVDQALTEMIQTYSQRIEREFESEAEQILSETEGEPTQEQELEIANLTQEVVTQLNAKKSDPVITFRRYSAKLTDETAETKLAVIKSVADGIVSPDVLKINESWINAVARRHKENFNIPNFTLVVAEKFKRKAGGK